ncbi:MAG: hypothetical protein HYZ00_03095 [Candidatus Hydrogenedentes bacterium]|nr:hypothetical protein [Candidatus Hydrogenedentota bacterium]
MLRTAKQVDDPRPQWPRFSFAGLALFLLIAAQLAQARPLGPLLDLGWSRAPGSSSEWKPEPWRVSRQLRPGTSELPHPEQSLRELPAVGGGATSHYPGSCGISETVAEIGFEVLGPGLEMAWTLTTTPIWTNAFPYLEISYEIKGKHQGDYPFLMLSDGSTGPVTPGANNPENPLASGGRDLFGSTGTQGNQTLVVDLRERKTSDRVAEITVFVRAGDGAAVVCLRKIQFWAHDPRMEIVSDTQGTAGLAPQAAPESAHFTPLAIPERPLAAKDALDAFGISAAPSERLLSRGMPFLLKATTAATGIEACEEIAIEAHRFCPELGLPIGTRLFGSEKPWYSAGQYQPRAALRSTRQASIRLRYTDGTETEMLPVCAASGAPEFLAGMHAYRVATDPAREIAEISVHDRVDYGQLILFAASVLESSAAPPPAGPPAAETAAVTQDSTPGYNLDGQTLSIECSAYHARISLSEGCTLESLTFPPATSNIIDTPTPLLAVSGRDAPPFNLSLLSLAVEDTHQAVKCAWLTEDKDLEVRLRLTLEPSGAIRLTPSLHSLAPTGREISIRCPDLTNIAPASGSEVEYLLGTRTPTLASGPCDTSEIYGGGYLMQFMDVSGKGGGGGLGLIVEDTALHRKWFQFHLDEGNSASMAVEYRDVHLAGGSTFRFPDVILLPHAGDWHVPFERYRQWVHAAFPPPPSTLMRADFFCRRDYPLGGTGYLYDISEQRYTPDRLIDESTEAFGGVDFIDISSWAYHENSGRVGDYLDNELGGLRGLRASAQQSHDRGSTMGLYFEGYLIDRRCPLAQQALPAWQLIGEDQKPRWWSGEMELFCCPGVPAWRKALAEQVAEVAAQTGIDAVYLDQLGNCGPGKECWSPAHGHPVPSNPLVEERALIKEVRAALAARNLSAALYIEHVPCDALGNLIDGAFNIGILSEKAAGPTRLPLQRFIFPHIAIFEMLAHGIRPVPAEESDLQLAIFHGLGLWLKGRGASWFSSQFRALAREYYPICAQYGAFFRAPKCHPLLPTLHQDIYANAFEKDGQFLLCVYNAGPAPVTGDLLRLPARKGGWQATPLLQAATLRTQSETEDAIISGTLNPATTAMLLLSSALS